MFLKFAKGNAKVGPNVYTFSLPSGWTCPYANECLSKSKREEGGIEDGPNTRFRCFSASQEAQYPAVRAKRWYNFDLLRKCANSYEMEDLISKSIGNIFLKRGKYKVPDTFTIRIHDSGDFFNEAYLRAWMYTAENYPDAKFYFYTKSLKYWLNQIFYIGNGHSPGKIPNMVPTASYGGRNDNLIEQYGLRSAIVVYSEHEATERGLMIDHDDTHAQAHGDDFALLIHGTQPKNSDASKALSSLKKKGFSGYSKNRQSLTMIS